MHDGEMAGNIGHAWRYMAVRHIGNLNGDAHRPSAKLGSKIGHFSIICLNSKMK